MKYKLVFKSIMIFLIVTISLLLVFLCIGFNPSKMSLSISDYIINNTNKVCDNNRELISSDGEYDYYIPCTMSNDIELIWNDGSKDYLKDAIRNKKVNVESLIKHGLRVYAEKH